jgi:hypothetical protein
LNFRYTEALSDAELSLKHDPTFNKSILRRATANVGLGNRQEAIKDLRKMFQLEPNNAHIRLLMSQVSQSSQMSSRFSEAFIGHYLRRVTTKLQIMTSHNGSYSSILFLRIMVSIHFECKCVVTSF